MELTTILHELKTLLRENKMLLSKIEEEQKSMTNNKSITDKKTEWQIYLDLKELGEWDDDSKLN